jgi:hypothetical protein
MQLSAEECSVNADHLHAVVKRPERLTKIFKQDCYYRRARNSLLRATVVPASGNGKKRVSFQMDLQNVHSRGRT